MDGFLGRSDNMVKLRGINVFPQAVGPILAEVAEFAGEYVCRVVRDDKGRDDMIVVAEVSRADESTEVRLREVLKRRLGIEVSVELAKPGATAPLTQVDVRQKPIRLIDARQ
jgi:phenylacetate-CoA ligase